MKLPLLVEFKPTINAVGPTVYLFPGSWVIESNQNDSRILVSFNDATMEINNGVHLKGDTTYKVILEEKGTESSITIYANKI